MKNHEKLKIACFTLHLKVVEKIATIFYAAIKLIQ